MKARKITVSGEGEWVLDIALGEGQWCASLSDLNIHSYDAASLVRRGSVPNAHKERINSISIEATLPWLLTSASSDKTVKLWDLRCSPHRAVQTATLSDEVLGAALGAGGALLAAASGNSIIFLDTRALGSGTSSSFGGGKPKIVAEYDDAHTDLVTQLRFHPTHSTQLASGGEDGLICLFDTAVPEGEEALVSVINTDCPIRRFGFFGNEGQGVFCLSCNEQLSLWHGPSAIRVTDVPAAREALGADYLLECFYSAESDTLQVLAGRNDGGLVFASVLPRSLSKGGRGLGDRGTLRVDVSFSGFAAAGQAAQHQAVVRCAAFVSSSSSSGLSEGGGGAGLGAGALLTGGEDGAVVAWTLPAFASASGVREEEQEEEEEEGEGEGEDTIIPNGDERRRERKERRREEKRARKAKKRKTEEE